MFLGIHNDCMVDTALTVDSRSPNTVTVAVGPLAEGPWPSKECCVNRSLKPLSTEIIPLLYSVLAGFYPLGIHDVGVLVMCQACIYYTV